MTLLALKLLLTPLLIAIATLIGRRWGPRHAGAFAGLPLTSAPVSAFLVVEQGTSFTERAAVATLAGLASAAVFGLIYARLALRRSVAFALLWATVAYVAASLMVAQFPISNAVLQFFVTGSILLFCIAGLPRASVAAAPGASAPGWDLPARVAVSTSLVLALTGLAHWLDPLVVGLLSPVPVFTAVLAGFTHAQRGGVCAVLFLRGVLLSSFGFAAFFLTVALFVRSSPFLAYSAATVAALVGGFVANIRDRDKALVASAQPETDYPR